MESGACNITFEWISGAKNKAANCLSWLVEQPMTIPATVKHATQLHTPMDLLQMLEFTQNRTLLVLPSPHTPMVHLAFLQMQLKHPNPLQQTDWKHYSKCKGLTHSADIFLNIYLMVKHHNMKQMFYSCKGITM